MSPRRVLVCGTNFGRFHAEAVLRRPDDYELAGILARGSAASREYADRLGVPFHSDVEAVPDDVEFACVAVGSAISAGNGTELAAALMARGIHVLQEHPLHLDEFTASLRTARTHGVQYRVNTHYPHVAPVRAFTDAARRLRERQAPLFVDAATPVHLLHPLVDILGAALGGLRPWRIGEPPQAEPGHPFRTLHGVVAGVPLTLRVHHQLDPADRDNHALLWHRIMIGTEGGVLTLADTHGPVLWSPRLHAHRDPDHRFVLDGPDTGHFDQPTTSALGPHTPVTFRDVFTDLWPDAIGRALDGLRSAADTRADVLRSAQYDLTVCRIWSEIAARLGPPEVVRPPAPRPVAADELGPIAGQWPARPADHGSAAPTTDDAVAPAAPHVSRAAHAVVQAPVAAAERRATAATDSYSPSAEFFDLVAGPYTATGPGPEVVRALAGLGAGMVLDLGAGTGLITEAVAKAFPDAEILAAEPAVGMRAALTSRVFSDPDLRRRVTVTDGAAPDLELPDRLDAVVLCGVLGHLDDRQRATLWRRLDARLAPGAPVVVELMGLDKPAAVPELPLAQAEIGTQSYTWWFSGEPEGERMRLRSRWTVHQGRALIREVHDTYTWLPFDLEHLARETGMDVQPLPTRPGGPPLAVLRRRDTRPTP
ncbi:Gfo/Idh/MocA family oxidoreductase [Yinghuangia sp. YIM S10712]|uniref:Gfo/Idh/MocA family oxidoreductase n=1 Tax=Yinghuangia sp. YIM S10712 TaxID=3436930 RepID=UPI003F534F2E